MASKIFALVAAFAALASAHVEMVVPAPFDAANLNNSPLDPSGSNFPCKAPNYGSIGTKAQYTIGGKGELQFIGTAVHGGGSCQVSITYDNPPTADSVWKVIKSFEGGCPSRTAAGNLPGDSAELPNPDTYQFTIPSIPTGEAILAWTWFNKVGNREMYMNCAPVVISGSGGTAEIYSALPDMFKANIGQTTCTTIADTDLQFPNPGADVEKKSGGAFQGPAGCPASGTTPAPATPAVPGGAFVPAPSKDAVVVAPAPAPAPASGGACTAGFFNCVDGTSFQMCDNGAWTAAQPVAPGTKCSGPPAASLNISHA